MFLGHSQRARRVQAQVHRALASNAPVLVVGGPGTGKRLIAEILHHFGGGEIPSLEPVRILEGRVERIGEFAYLDALERLDPSEQARLPNLLGLGRLVIGTQLEPESEAGRARLHGPLLRWCGVRIDLPTLSERIEDLEPLALAILQRTPTRRPVGGISDSALDCLRSHPWPGNVRELEQVLIHALEVGNGDQVELGDLPAHLHPGSASGDSTERCMSLDQAERQAIKRALDYTRGNKRQAARLLNIGKTTLYRKIKAYELA